MKINELIKELQIGSKLYGNINVKLIDRGCTDIDFEISTVAIQKDEKDEDESKMICGLYF